MVWRLSGRPLDPWVSVLYRQIWAGRRTFRRSWRMRGPLREWSSSSREQSWKSYDLQQKIINISNKRNLYDLGSEQCWRLMKLISNAVLKCFFLFLLPYILRDLIKTTHPKLAIVKDWASQFFRDHNTSNIQISTINMHLPIKIRHNLQTQYHWVI